jgi:hypothetical protein
VNRDALWRRLRLSFGGLIHRLDNGLIRAGYQQVPTPIRLGLVGAEIDLLADQPDIETAGLCAVEWLWLTHRKFSQKVCECPIREYLFQAVLDEANSEHF